MKFLNLRYLNGNRLLVNPVVVRIINETSTNQYGLCSLIEFIGTAHQVLVMESIDDIQAQMDESGGVSKDE